MQLKPLFLALTVTLLGTHSFADSSIFAEYSAQKGKFNNDINEDLNGFAIGYSSITPDYSGVWTKGEYLQNNNYKADYYEWSFGGQTAFYKANNAYVVGTFGFGIGSAKANYFDHTTYFTLPIGLEAGYQFTQKVSLYGGVGYKWNWDISNVGENSNSGGSRCKDGTWSNSSGSGTCSWHGGIASSSSYNSEDNTIGSFNGITYKAGLRFKF